jgi:hypothetical protein
MRRLEIWTLAQPREQPNPNVSPTDGLNDYHRVFNLSSATSLALPVVFFSDIVLNAGTLTLTLLGTDIQLDWTGHPGIRVQSNTTLNGGTWVDDLTTDGLSSVVYPLGNGNKLYRLRYSP